MTTKQLAGRTVHFYKTFSYPLPGSALGRPVIIDRGGELILTEAILNELRDRHGALPQWLENIEEPNPDSLTEPIAALGPWPEGKSTYIYGELSWAEERQRRLNIANAIHDPAERQRAISQINKELGLAVPMNSNVFAY